MKVKVTTDFAKKHNLAFIHPNHGDQIFHWFPSQGAVYYAKGNGFLRGSEYDAYQVARYFTDGDWILIPVNATYKHLKKWLPTGFEACMQCGDDKRLPAPDRCYHASNHQV